MQRYRVEYLSGHYRVADYRHSWDGDRVATCHLREHAILVAAALNFASLRENVVSFGRHHTAEVINADETKEN